MQQGPAATSEILAGLHQPRPAERAGLTGAELDRQVFAEQLRLLYGSATPLLVNAINAAIMSALLWFLLPRTTIVVWAASVIGVVLVRAEIRRRFRADSESRRLEDWALRYVIGAGVTGALWGAMAGVVPATDELAYHMLVGLTAAGMVAGAVGVSSAYLPSFYVFIVPALAPMVIVFLAAGDTPHVALGLMSIVFGIAMTMVARAFNRSLIETLRLRFVNADLIRDLSVARDMAEQVSRSNWETLAHLSHELRTPLNAIGGFGEIMRSRLFGALGHAKYEDYVRDICDSAAHLTSLVDEILMYSRGHTGTLRLDEAVIDTAGEIAGCVQMVAETARSAQIELSSDIADDLPALRADAVKLRQIVLNLLSNALKFTPAGGRVSLTARTEPTGVLAISIADTGIGMDAADLPRVMEPYVQLENAFVRKRRSAGLGLGLPIVKQLIDLHGGSIVLESAPGVGTTVTVRFPPERSLIGGSRPGKADR